VVAFSGTREARQSTAARVLFADQDDVPPNGKKSIPGRSLTECITYCLARHSTHIFWNGHGYQKSLDYFWRSFGAFSKLMQQPASAIFAHMILAKDFTTTEVTGVYTTVLSKKSVSTVFFSRKSSKNVLSNVRIYSSTVPSATRARSASAQVSGRSFDEA
jgi:hypothetical protein